jgi:polyamine oxidase
MNFIRQVFPQVPVPDPVKYKFTRWSQDPFAYGSYSNYAVHSNSNTVELLARDTADGRVHWAGEHTNTSDNDNEWDIGFVHSAFRSGQRAATAIINQLCSSSSS